MAIRLHPGDHRILEDTAVIDDRGLEYAEAILHERRLQDRRAGIEDKIVDRALAALSAVRNLTRRR